MWKKLAVAFVCLVPLMAQGQVKIGLMVSATGPTSAIGIPQKNTAALLPTRIGDASVEYFQLEDGGDSTRAVQNAKKLIGEENVDALIGPRSARKRSPIPWTTRSAGYSRPRRTTT